MQILRIIALAGAAFLLSVSSVVTRAAHIVPDAGKSDAGVEKTNAYVGCINALSARAHASRERYFSWVNAKTGPTGKERIVYGVYTIYDTSDCKGNVEKASAWEPHDPRVESAANAYVAAVTALEPLLKEADDYYTQEDYKDDKMAKGKALHPKLVAAWDAFAAADRALRDGVDAITDSRAAAKLAAIEKSEGKNARYYVEALMIDAKRVLRLENAEKPDLQAIEKSVEDYEASVKGIDNAAGAKESAAVGSLFMSNAKSFLASAKQFMRRIRDHTPYSTGDKMMIDAGSGWMIEGSPQRLLRDYNQLVDGYNGGANV